MRKLTVILLSALVVLISLSSFSFAQSDTTRNNKWGCAIAINSTDAQFGKPEEDSWGYSSAYGSPTMERTDKSFSVSIIPKYYINNHLLLRFEFCITNFNVEIIFNTKNNLPTLTNYTDQGGISKQRIYRYTGGIQYNFFKTKRFESFAGMSASYTNYKAMTFDAYSYQRNNQTDTIVSSVFETGTNPGGFNAGIGTLAGFNFYLQKHFSIGAEFSASLLYYEIGGADVGEQTYQTVPQPPVTKEYQRSITSYKGLKFSKIMPSLNIGVWF